MNGLFSLIPLTPEQEYQEWPCGYYSDRTSRDEICAFSWLEQMCDYLDYTHCTLPHPFVPQQLFNILLEQGFRRSGNLFYRNKCQKCKECVPIRVKIEDFKSSKSQRKAYRINSDIQVVLNENPKTFATDEKAFLYREYDFYHNHKEKMSIEEAKETLQLMNSGYCGIMNMEYYLNGRLIAVGLLDYSLDEYQKPYALSSNYFYYDVSPEILKRSIGIFSVLKEIELCKKLGITYYYLGLYLKNCRKMNYKTNYKPYELLEKGRWYKYEDGKRSVVKEKDEPLEVLPFFPPNDRVFKGFVAATEDIPVDLLYSAYNHGIFPWFNEEDGDPVLWQSPDPRFVILPENLHIPKSVEKFLKHSPYTYTKDRCFKKVMENCGKVQRPGQNGTWIGPKMLKAYTQLHKKGIAHSYEVWHEKELVGGFYGIEIGAGFFGESMFTLESNSAKSAFCKFAKEFFANGGKLIDCQAYTENMARFGAIEISRKKFLELLSNIL